MASSETIIESLTSKYPDDGDAWYTLGLTYFQLKKWGKAIAALKKTLDFGTILSNVPTGSAPSNDIMNNIA